MGKSYPTFWMRCPCQLRCHPFCVHEGLWGSNIRKKVRHQAQDGEKEEVVQARPEHQRRTPTRHRPAHPIPSPPKPTAPLPWRKPCGHLPPQATAPKMSGQASWCGYLLLTPGLG